MEKTPNEQTLENEREEKEYFEYQMFHHRERNVVINKQPLFVHNYTQKGYKKMKMPSKLYALISSFYRGNYSEKFDEPAKWKVEGQLINQKAVRTSLIWIDIDTMNMYAEILKPILEDWCKCSLVFTMGYGIREYYGGNVLQRHVDRIKTHVIGVILQVHQELEGADWLLEVINFNGDRNWVKLLPGEMLLYESAKVIHSRPEVFQGSKFANCFLHFAPTTGWNFDYDGKKIWDSTRIEYLAESSTSLTKEKNMFRKFGGSDEL